MKEHVYNAVNTTVRLMETRLLTQADFDALLHAENLHEALGQLKKTRYDFDVEAIENEKNFDALLTGELHKQYQELLEAVPDPRVINLLTLRYTYHNLKVLLKGRFTGKDLSALLLPIGLYSRKALENLVETGQSEHLPSIMVEAVSLALAEYEESKRVQAADIYMDTYYFKHLRALANELEDQRFTTLVDTMIDLKNLSTLVRARSKERSRSFLMTVLSSSGTVAKQDLVNRTESGQLKDVLSLFEGKDYSKALESVFSLEDTSQLAMQLESLENHLIHEFLATALFEGFGPMPVLAYLFAVEMETRNIRLILVGKDNGFSEEAIRERMSPINVA